MKGLVHIYTGDGKGKTTAAIGLGVRAYGRGLKVLMVQFLKGMETGEMFTLKLLEPGFVLHRSREVLKFTWDMTDEELSRTRQIQKEILDYAVDATYCGGWDMVILDEVMGALSSGVLDLKDVLDFVKDKPDRLEIVMTGRNAPAELIELADYVSEIKCVKHPIDNGIPARKGIEC